MNDCYKPFCEQDLISLTLDYVKFNSEAKKCLRPNTGAYLKDWSEISDKDLGKDIKDHGELHEVYMRSAKNYYPAIVVTPDSLNFEGHLRQSKGITEVDTYEIAFLDERIKENDRKVKCTECQRRSERRIREDLREVIRQYLEYMRQAIFASYTMGGAEYSGWINKDHLAYIEANNTLTDLNTYNVQSNNGRRDLENINKNLNPKFVFFGRTYVGFVLKFSISKYIVTETKMDFGNKDINKAGK